MTWKNIIEQAMAEVNAWRPAPLPPGRYWNLNDDFDPHKPMPVEFTAPALRRSERCRPHSYDLEACSAWAALMNACPANNEYWDVARAGIIAFYERILAIPEQVVQDFQVIRGPLGDRPVYPADGPFARAIGEACDAAGLADWKPRTTNLFVPRGWLRYESNPLRDPWRAGGSPLFWRAHVDSKALAEAPVISGSFRSVRFC